MCSESNQPQHGILNLVRFTVRGALAAGGLLLAAASGGTAQADPVTLTVWSNTYISEAGKRVFEDYQKATGNTLDVQYIPDPFEQTVLQKWAAGERPDVLYFHAIPKWLLRLNPKETLFDLADRPFVAAAKGDFLMQSAAYDGHIYGAPLDAPSVLGAFYNKPLFARLGLTPPANLAELEKVLAAIKADGKVPPIFSAGGTQWPLLLLPYAAMQDLVTGSDFASKLRVNQAKWTDQPVVAAIQVERDFFDKGYYNSDVLSATFDQEIDAIATAKAGMIINQSAAVVSAMVDKYGLDQVNRNVGFFGFSTKDSATGWFGLSPGVGAGAAYVPKTGDATKEKVAKEYVDWITGANYAHYIAASGTLPYYKGVEPSAKVPQCLLDAQAALEKRSGPSIEQYMLADFGPMPQYLQELLAGSKSAADVAAALQTDYLRSGKLIGLPGF
jgi:raffinose/stachyose/melibiose transport system substrate-binding protein